MPRLLWLVYERVPHPDAVCCPADEETARFVLELLAQPYARRRQLAEQLRRFVRDQSKRPVFSRQSIACRGPNGLFRLVPWRLAKWLSHVLPAEDGVIERPRTRIRHWLENGEQAEIVGTANHRMK